MSPAGKTAAVGSWLAANERRVLVVLGALAVALRLLYAFAVVSPRLTDDETHFWAIAGNVVHGRGYSYLGEATAWRPPVYTYAVALSRWVGLGVRGIQVVQAVVAVATVVLTRDIARRLRVPAWAALLAAATAAAYPAFVHLSSQVLSENASIPLLLVAVLATLRAFDRPSWVAGFLGGAAWGLAILARPAALPAFAVAAAVLLFVHWRAALVLAAACAVAVAPWIARNDRAVGGPVPVVSNESFTLWVSNRLDTDELKDVFRDPAYPGLQDYGVYGRDFPGIEALAAASGFDFDHADEAERDRWFRSLVVDDVRADPVRFVTRAAAKSVLALSPAPDNASQQERTSAAAKVALWVAGLPVLALGLTGLVLLARRGGPPGVFLALAAAVSLVGLATHLPYVRYRVGAVDPLLIPAAAWLLAGAPRRRRSPTT